MQEPTLRDRFCQVFKCSQAQFERRERWECLRSPARLAFTLLRLVPEYFSDDYYLLQSVGKAIHVSEVSVIATSFGFRPHLPYRFLRQTLRLRMSRLLLIQLAKRLLTPTASLEISHPRTGSARAMRE
jgi:hypothetical protein